MADRLYAPGFEIDQFKQCDRRILAVSEHMGGKGGFGPEFS